MNVRRGIFESCRWLCVSQWLIQSSTIQGPKNGAVGYTRSHVDSGRMNDITSLAVMSFLPNLSMVGTNLNEMVCEGRSD